MATIQFRASPSKRTCGLLIVGEGARTLRLLVLPRFWKDAVLAHWLTDDDQTLSLVAPEGANVKLSLDVDGWQPLIEKAMRLAN